MSHHDRRVVVTGLGVVTPIGSGLENFWSALMRGESGAGPITQFDTEKFDTKFAASVKNFDPLTYIDRKMVQRMDLFTQFAMASTAMAVEHSKIDLNTIDLNRVGVIFGSGIGGMTTYHKQQQTFFETGGPQRISPFFVPMMISDIAAGYISIRYGFKGVNYATTSACATSAHAIIDAAMHIKLGGMDAIICGGSEAAICPMAIGGFNAMKALSTRNDDPLHASRPFDLTRDGFVLGEGSASLVLEELQHALDRGATIYGELLGSGATGDAYHITAPPPGGDGAVRSMQTAIRSAGLQPSDVQYINAHGTSTPPNDKNETAAIKTVFGDHASKLFVSSTKSMTGHLLGAAGAVEAVASILTILNNTIPPTINYSTPDPDCDLNYVPLTPLKTTVDVALSNVFGFGGHNATLIFGRYIG